MEILDKKTDKELLQSLLAEIAKARNELNCLNKDADKINNRISFALVVINTLLNRKQQFQD